MDKNANGDGSRIESEEQQKQSRQVRFVEDGVKTNYSNVFNIGFGQEEVIFIYGTHSVEPGVVRVENKIAVSIKTAKRIAITLGNLLRRYEAINGVIDVSNPKQTTDEKPNVQ